MRASFLQVLLWAFVALAEERPVLTVEVGGLPSARGHVECVLWKAEAGFPKEVKQSAATVKVPAEAAEGRAGRARCVFVLDGPGWYAVSFTHDENDNGRLDTGLFGIPTEGYGFTRDPRPLMRAPRFDEAALEVPAQGATVRARAQ
jgi:uncharacterized protein (DUF2141 family)